MTLKAPIARHFARSLGLPRRRNRLEARLLALVAVGALLASTTMSDPAAGLRAPNASQDAGAAQVVPSELFPLVYGDLLGAGPSEMQVHVAADRLGSGLAPELLVTELAGSEEVRGAYEPAIRLYRSAFLRPPDRAGLTYWVDQFRSGTSFDDIADFFANSQEFQRRYGHLSNDRFVDRVYRNVLGRSSDPSGRDYWVGILDQGVARGALLIAFSESAEHARKTRVATVKTMLHATLLQRSVSTAQMERWDGQPTELNLFDEVSLTMRSKAFKDRLAEAFPYRTPLTGQAWSSMSLRPALAIKIDNVDQARPQQGINQADLVYEEMVEGNLTRLVAVFHSQSPKVVGPVRSVRTSDFDILAPLNGPLLGASGANRGVLSALRETNIVDLNASLVNDYWRDYRRRAPHNLYTSPEGLWSHAPAEAAPPPVLLRHVAAAGGEPAGASVEGIDLEFGRASVGWRWDEDARVWRRRQNGTVHEDASGNAVAAQNVIVMVTEYRSSWIDQQSPEAITVGRHRAMAFIDGRWIDGHWRRSESDQPIRYYDKAGAEITFRPGQTWIELVPPLASTIVPS